MNSTAHNTQQNILLPEIDDLIGKINASKTPQDLKNRMLRMLKRLELAARLGNFSNEFESIKKYIDWVISIPWGKYTKDELDLAKVREIMDKHHYGLDQVKENILEYLAVMKLKRGNINGAELENNISNMKKLEGSSSHAPILCFVGIQGVGKTSMAKSIALALNRQFVRISLGAMNSATMLRGKTRVEADSEPGQIIKALVNTRTMNPLILLDEIDKVSNASGLREDIMASLLEILDPEQNKTFVDHFIDYPVDLSKVIFITTANNLGGMSTALLDRLEIIRFSSYSADEKKIIAKKYLLPKVLKATGLTKEQLEFSDDVWDLIVSPLGFDAGVRQLERNLTKIARKVARQIVDGMVMKVVITPNNFREYIPQDIDVYS